MTTKKKNKKVTLTYDEVINALENRDSELVAVVEVDRDWVWIPSRMTDGKDQKIIERRKLLSSLGFRFKANGDREVNGTPCRWAHNCGKWIPSKRSSRRKETDEKEEAPDLSAFGM